MAKKAKAATAAKKKAAKASSASVAKTFRAIREQAKEGRASGGRKPIDTILALVETGLKQLSGKASE